MNNTTNFDGLYVIWISEDDMIESVRICDGQPVETHGYEHAAALKYAAQHCRPAETLDDIPTVARECADHIVARRGYYGELVAVCRIDD